MSKFEGEPFVVRVGNDGEQQPSVATTNVFKPVLKRGELVQRQYKHKIRNATKYTFAEFRYRGSVIPAILVPGCITTVWSAIWTILFHVANWRWLAVPNQLIGIISVVMGLLLVFRTNTAYDRFWSARVAWGTLTTHSRNLARFVWCGVKAGTDKEKYEKSGALNLILGYSIAVKHTLRGESGLEYEDLYSLLKHVPQLRKEDIDHIPLEISYHLTAYVTKCRAKDLADIPTSGNMLIAISGMVDCLTNFERIRNSPVPIAYSIHLKQTLMVYLLTLPFQLLSTMGWVTIAVVFVASFTLLGIEAIGTEIENPFGYDENDLRLEVFCADLKTELEEIKEKPMVLDSADWDIPASLANYDNLDDISQYK